jgi:hypothetical protein
LVLVLVAAGLVAMFARGGAQRAPTIPGGHLADPFAWTPAHEPALAAAAARGTSHLLYALSPGGAEASAARTARWRGLVNAAARRAGVDPSTLEGLVFLESAGRADAVTPAGLDGAVGLTQILPETARDLLHMRVDVAAAKRLTRRITRARGRRAAALVRRRARVDQRFDPRASLNGTARYLALARARFGRSDLAFVSYHMGIGNLEGVLRAYSGESGGAIGDVVRNDHLDYARVYFDSTPARHADAWRRLAAFGDDSSNYLWKVMAARGIMRLWRGDRGRLRQLEALQTAGDSAEFVLRPPSSTPRFADADALRSALDAHTLLPFPDRPSATGLRAAARPAIFRALRPEALALAVYLGAQARALSHTGPLEVTAAVRDARAPATGGEPAGSAAMHDTGWAFDVRRRYRSPAQAQAFQFLLDRLQVLDVIAWSRERTQIHITVGRAARALLPLVERVSSP